MKRIFRIILLAVLILCAVITLHLTSVSGIVIDENGLSAAQYCGGSGGLRLHWVRVALLLIGTIAAIFNLADD